jgi:hypothetical protein
MKKHINGTGSRWINPTTESHIRKCPDEVLDCPRQVDHPWPTQTRVVTIVSVTECKGGVLRRQLRPRRRWLAADVVEHRHGVERWLVVALARFQHRGVDAEGNAILGFYFYFFSFYIAFKVIIRFKVNYYKILIRWFWKLITF